MYSRNIYVIISVVEGIHLMEYKIARDKILLCKIMIFDGYNASDGRFIKRKLSNDELLRRVIFTKEGIIDFKTGDVIEQLDYDEEGFVIGEVRANTMYVEELFSIQKSLTDEEYEYAQVLYKYFLDTKRLYDEGKIVSFKQKRLY